MSAPCPDCGLPSWDAEDLEPGGWVCTCGPCCDIHDAQCAPDDQGGYCCDACPTLARDEGCRDPDCTCGDGDPGRPIVTINTGGLL